MTLELWWGEPPNTAHEREALTTLLRAMRDMYAQSDQLILLLANFFVGGRQIDLTILKPDGPVVVELKECRDPIRATENGDWVTLPDEKVIGTGNQNPFQQVREYRFKWKDWLEEHAPQFIPPNKVHSLNQKRGFYQVAAYVAITPQLHPDSQNLIEQTLWFRLVGLNELPQAAANYISRDLNFSDAEMRQIIELLQLSQADTVLFEAAPADPAADVPAAAESAAEPESPPEEAVSSEAAAASDEAYLTPREAGDLTGLKYREVFQLARQGKIRSRRDEAGDLRVSRADVLAHKPQAGQPHTRPPQPYTPATSPAPGDVLQERYLLDTILGEPGGFGQVFKAYNQKLNGWRAIKQLTYLPAVDSFEREGQLLERLNHPGLPKVYDLFEEGGNYYLVMAYIEGETLSQRLKQRGPVTEAQALAWADQLLDTLEYLHRQGIVHRDVKPLNIIIPADDDNRAILVDLGIARSGDQTHPYGTSKYYSPPEQNEADIDVRADIYSLGATLYVLLSGQKLPTPADRTNQAVLLPLRDFNPAISNNTAAVIEKALALNRDDRWPNAAAMRRALSADPPDIVTDVTR